MTLTLFALFLVASVISELYIYRKEIVRIQSKKVRRLYIWSALIFWGISAAGILPALIMNRPPDWLMKSTEVILVFFLFNGTAKFIFTVLTWIGRRTKHLPFFYCTATVLIVITHLIMTYGGTTGRLNLREERVKVASPKISPSLDGFRIAVFSDLHLGHLLDKYDMLEKIVDAINEADADIVVNAGDFVNNEFAEVDERSMEILSRIESRYGVYSVLGNHDMGKYLPKKSEYTPEETASMVAARQESMGWRVLRDQTDMVAVGSDSLYISGIDFPSELLMSKSSHGKLESEQEYGRILGQVPANKFGITLSHAPQAWEQLRATGKSDLAISGHVHSFQMKIGLGGNRVWSPAKFFYKEWSGLYRENDDYLYINDGIGYAILPLRIGCKPELTIIELERYESDSVGGDDQ